MDPRKVGIKINLFQENGHRVKWFPKINLGKIDLGRLSTDMNGPQK